jgi:cytochrome c5
MSDNHTSDDSSGDVDHDASANHEGPIRTPKQLVVAVVASFLVPIIAIILLVNYVDFGSKEGAGSDGMQTEAVAKRLQRVGSVEIRDANAPTVLRTGDQVFAAQCTACHTAGAAGAPKVGDASAWGPRIKTGYDALLNSALKGKGAMGAQGGGDFSDVEVGRAVVYMANQAGGKFAEPKAPVAAASAASAAN